MIVSEMSVEEVASAKTFEKHFWEDGENALEIVAKYLPDEGKVSNDSFRPSFQPLELMNLKSTLQYIISTNILGKLRLTKDEYEVKKLEVSTRIADEVVEGVMEFIKPGMKESEVVKEITRLFTEKEASDLSFSPIVETGPKGAIPHHSPGETKIKEGDMIVLDLGGMKEHYCSDNTRTFVAGEPTEEMKKIYKVVKDA